MKTRMMKTMMKINMKMEIFLKNLFSKNIINKFRSKFNNHNQRNKFQMREQKNFLKFPFRKVSWRKQMKKQIQESFPSQRHNRISLSRKKYHNLIISHILISRMNSLRVIVNPSWNQYNLVVRVKLHITVSSARFLSPV